MLVGQGLGRGRRQHVDLRGVGGQLRLDCRRACGGGGLLGGGFALGAGGCAVGVACRALCGDGVRVGAGIAFGLPGGRRLLCGLRGCRRVACSGKRRRRDHADRQHDGEHGGNDNGRGFSHGCPFASRKNQARKA